VKIVLIPGWDENSTVMQTFVDGRHGIDGLAGFGFDCTIFPNGTDGLRDRIDRFARFLEALRAREPDAFPVATVGYSAGGLVNRGFLRAYPERAHEIAATIQIGAPNTGLISRYIANLLRVMWIPHAVVLDLDVASPFLLWLNGVSGHWVPTGIKGRMKWQLVGDPWVIPEGHRYLAIAGHVPRFRHPDVGDGVILLDSATLEGRAPSVVLHDPKANHLNLGAVFNPVAFVFRGFTADDRIWRRNVETIARFLRGEELEGA
jgi:pimeloyl-ACP methyl ester carboxylesterase